MCKRGRKNPETYCWGWQWILPPGLGVVWVRSLLSAPGSGLRSASDLAGVPIGISKNTIIEYVTDRLLAAEGLDQKKITKKSVPVIPERYQLLLQGQLKAATLAGTAKLALVFSVLLSTGLILSMK